MPVSRVTRPSRPSRPFPFTPRRSRGRLELSPRHFRPRHRYKPAPHDCAAALFSSVTMRRRTPQTGSRRGRTRPVGLEHPIQTAAGTRPAKSSVTSFLRISPGERDLGATNDGEDVQSRLAAESRRRRRTCMYFRGCSEGKREKRGEEGRLVGGEERRGEREGGGRRRR